MLAMQNLKQIGLQIHGSIFNHVKPRKKLSPRKMYRQRAKHYALQQEANANSAAYTSVSE